ncbi:UNVERIFIED_CONTAM: hypothetical protein FKN15_062045 [Acipenser sinensis]
MASDSASQNPSCRIMTFYPTREEFQNFIRYIAYIESQGAHRAGLAKIVPPKDWKPRRCYDGIDELVIPAPIQQVVTGQSGLFTQYNIQKKPMTLREFRKIANSDKFCNPHYADFEELERKYWKNLTFNPPIYGADVNGTLYDPDITEWNIGHLNTILDTVELESGITIEGVNTPYLYFGMWKTTFAWHIEDMDLYSINYLHFGEPKSCCRIMTFYPTREEFQNFIRYIAYIESQGAHRAGLAKIVPPKDWKPRRCYDGIDELVIPAPIQQVVTGQSGLFTQYNIQKKPMTLREFRKIANSDKFCNPHYADFEELERKYWKNLTFNPPIYGADVNGTLYDPCSCRKDMVKISMDVFVQKFQPDRYKQWKAGKDNAAIDHSRPTPEAAEFLKEGNGDSETEMNSSVGSTDESETTITQEAGEFMITFPYGYHAGFNHGFNCAESTNFATQRWIEYGKQATLCSCRKDMVKISMDVFVQKFQPDRYKQWKAGKDNAAIDHSRPTPEAAEFLKEGNGDSETEMNSSVGSTDETKVEELQPVKCETVGEVVVDQSVSPTPVVEYSSHEVENPIVPDNETSLAHDDNVNLLHLPKSQKHIVNSHISKEVSPASRPQSPVVAGTSGDYLTGGAPPCLPRSGAACLVLRKTLSPAEVLHVHSYAKGSYSEAGAGSSSERRVSTGMIGKEQGDAQIAEEDLDSVKSKRQPLDKLPRHHPLVKDCFSDEEMQEQIHLDEDTAETEQWAKSLVNLWQTRPHNLQAEREYNRNTGLEPPYCAVCMLFQTYHQSEYDGNNQSTLMDSEGRLRTKPLIPEMCFSTNEVSNDLNFSAPYLEEDGTSLLITCSNCCVRVHTSCYGVAPEKVSDDWKCSRCEANAMMESCCLCSLRGGALQRANNDKWVHVLCAVAVLEARFVNLAERSPVDLSGIPLQRFKLPALTLTHTIKGQQTTDWQVAAAGYVLNSTPNQKRVHA